MQTTRWIFNTHLSIYYIYHIKGVCQEKQYNLCFWQTATSLWKATSTKIRCKRREKFQSIDWVPLNKVVEDYTVWWWKRNKLICRGLWYGTQNQYYEIIFENQKLKLLPKNWNLWFISFLYIFFKRMGFDSFF